MNYNFYGFPGMPMANNIQSGTSDIQGVPGVSSINEVYSASVPYGKQIFMDRNQYVFYLKDYTGNIKAFSFKEIPVPGVGPNMENYVTREEFDNLRNKYEQLINTDANATTNTTAQPNAQQSTQPVANYATTQYDSTASTTGVLQSGSTDGIDPYTTKSTVG